MLQSTPPNPSAGRPNGAAEEIRKIVRDSREGQDAQRSEQLPGPGAERILRRLQDLQETAYSMHISPHTLRKMVREGKIHPVRICRRLLFTVDEIARVIAESN